MKDVITLLQNKIQIKTNEISRMERDLAIAKSLLHNDIRSLVGILMQHYPQLIQKPESDYHDPSLS